MIIHKTYITLLSDRYDFSQVVVPSLMTHKFIIKPHYLTHHNADKVNMGYDLILVVVFD